MVHSFDSIVETHNNSLHSFDGFNNAFEDVVDNKVHEYSTEQSCCDGEPYVTNEFKYNIVSHAYIYLK